MISNALSMVVASPEIAVFVRSGVDERKIETDFQRSKTAGNGEVTYSLESIVDTIGTHSARVEDLNISFALHGCSRTQGLTAASVDPEMKPSLNIGGKVGPGFRFTRSWKKLREPPFVYGWIAVDAERALELKTTVNVSIQSRDPKCRAVLSVDPSYVHALERWFKAQPRPSQKPTRTTQ